MGSRTSIRWLARAAMLGLLAVVALSGSGREVAEAGPAEDKMTVIDPASPVGVGGAFSVYIQASTDERCFQGYQGGISFNPSIVNATAVTQLQPAGMTLCGGTTINNIAGNAYDHGCAALTPIGPFTGNVTRFDMTCVGPGTSPVHLINLIEDPSFGSTLLGCEVYGGSLYDGSVTCEEQSDIAVTKADSPDPVVAGDPLT